MRELKRSGSVLGVVVAVRSNEVHVLTPWAPDIEFRQRKGVSAYRYARTGFVASVAFTALLFVAIILGTILRDALMDSPLVLLLILPILVAGGVMGWNLPAYEIRMKQEARAGYATVRSGKAELAEVDWKSSRVIRLPGEPRLSPDEERRRRELVRSASTRLTGPPDGAEGVRGL